MKPTSLLFALPILLLATSVAPAAVTFNGSGTSGFGGAIGGSSMQWSDNGTTISVTFTKGSGGFNDSFVIYLDNGGTGRNAIGTAVNDRADPLRSAISYMEASTGHTLTLPSGFEATHAIGIDTGFGGLWSIPSTGTVGNNGLGFVNSVGSTLTSASQGSFTFSFNVADLGVTPNSGATINFVATYLNEFGGSGSLGFASNEGYGGGFPGSNIEQASFSFTSGLSYTIVPEPSAALLGGLGVLALLRRRR
jgi:hypothetical protein